MMSDGTMPFSLKDFLKTGRLGDLGPGDDKEKVLQLLGFPKGTPSGKNPKEAVTWDYGAIQLQFRGDRIHSLSLTFEEEGFSLPGCFSTSGWFPQRTSTLEVFQTFLAEAGLKFHIDPVLADLGIRDQVNLCIGVAARAIFLGSTEGIRLQAIHYRDPNLNGLTTRKVQPSCTFASRKGWAAPVAG